MNIDVRNLNVSITSARIKGLEFEFDDEGMPIMTAKVQLISAGGKPITTVWVRQSEYSKGPGYFSSSELPMSIYEAIGKVVAELRDPLMLKFNSIDKLLEHEGMDAV